tara:strand:- start:436 stop:1080 length:645 start_codon:yes stop_codon:yes gene_type:complete
MNKENKVHSMWPTFIGEFHNPNHSEIKDDLIIFFKDYMKNNSSRKNLGENFKLFESEYDLHNYKNPAFTKLLNDFIMKGFLSMAKEANKKTVSKLDEKTKFNITIKDSWFIHYEKGGFVLPHFHGYCSWCCVYYVELGDDANSTNGATFFQKPIPPRATPDFGSEYNKYMTTSFEPEEGKMFIWPYYLMHGSYPYSGDKNRIIVSANATVSIEK